MTTRLSTIERAINLAHTNGGKLSRQGNSTQWGTGKAGQRCVTSKTVRVLVQKRLARYSDYRQGRNFGFYPCEITLT